VGHVTEIEFGRGVEGKRRLGTTSENCNVWESRKRKPPDSAVTALDASRRGESKMRVGRQTEGKVRG
jgi:hypothetical protein